MTEIIPRLYLGSIRSINLSTLNGSHVSVIINVADDFQTPILFQRQFNCISFGLRDKGIANNKICVQLAVNAIRSLWDYGETILIHCKAGMNRSPYIVASYLQSVDSPQQDFMHYWNQVRAKRSVVMDLPNFGIEDR
jgi:protein-tyrosine phosphatase